MKREIIDRGYLTHALTNHKGKIYGLVENHYINWKYNDIERQNTFYWSEVFVDGATTLLVRQGQLLKNPTPEELENYFEQSKTNLH